MVLLFFILLIVYFSYNFYYDYSMRKKISEMSLENVRIKNKTIQLDSLTIRQKLAQMIMVRADKEELLFNNLGIGGIFLDKQGNVEDYTKVIKTYQDDAKIKLLVATDMEGSWTPFKNPPPELDFPYFSEIKNKEQAYDVGLEHGKILKKMGFNLNFAPIAEYSDKAYGGRVFNGSEKEIKEKLEGYIEGLQKNVMGTCKHFPGKSMLKNLHRTSNKQEIKKRDLELFDLCVKNNISAVMVSHVIATGEVDSRGKPSTVSKEVIDNLDDDVLVIADEISMKGLKKFYPDKSQLYVDMINSGENFILDFYMSPVDIYELIEELEKKIGAGDIDIKQVDNSVKKILLRKGYRVE